MLVHGSCIMFHCSYIVQWQTNINANGEGVLMFSFCKRLVWTLDPLVRFPTCVLYYCRPHSMGGFATGPSQLSNHVLIFFRIFPVFLRIDLTHLRLGTKVHPLTQVFWAVHRVQISKYWYPPVKHCMFSRHVSLSHQPTKETQTPSRLFTFVPQP